MVFRKALHGAAEKVSNRKTVSGTPAVVPTPEQALALQEEVDRLRFELESEAKRRSRHPSLLETVDECICKEATELALEQSHEKDLDVVWDVLVQDLVECSLNFKALSAERDELKRREAVLELEIASEVALQELPRHQERWVRMCSGALLLDDAKATLEEEQQLLNEARSGKDQDLEAMLREMEVLEVTNTQLCSFEPEPADGPTLQRERSDSVSSVTSASSLAHKPGRLHRLGRWLIGRDAATTSLPAANLAASAPGELLVDDLITCCWEARNWQPGVYVKYPEPVLKSLLASARDVFMSECSLLEIDAPVCICGDIHGQYHDLLRLFEAGGAPPASNYLFLGDYVDRGRQSIETITLLFVYKVKYRDNFFLLRGNHECASITRMYGFYDECKRRYNVGLWKAFCDVFNCMPVCGLVDEKIMCMHGGLSPLLDDFEEVRMITKPADVPHRGIMCDLLWADPEQCLEGWQPSDRGVSYVFGPNVVKDFVAKHDLELICRAHQVMEDGYEFFADRRLVTVFSAPNYCGEFDNLGAFMVVAEDLRCRFEILKPEYA